MAGAVARQNDSLNPPFSQQGQVDWVNLANHSVNFSIGILSRLSKMGVDPLTIVVGKGLCRNMPLSPLGQKRVFEALSTLKSFSSFGQAIWLGFGVRHIVHELTATEEGMTFIALSAALQVSYDSFFGAQLFRELSLRRGAPESLLPALHQWQALLHVSAGVLSTSKFPQLLNGFSRILAPPRSNSSIPPTYATAPSDLAQALCLLSDVASGQTACCTFVGGIDCAWIAAVAEWLYCVSVEIRSETSSEVQYRLSAGISSPAQSPRIVIVKNDGGSRPTTVLSKAFILPSGGNLIFGEHLRNRQYLQKARFERRSKWSHILTDVFGDAVQELLQGSTGTGFAYLIRHQLNRGSPLGTFLGSNDMPGSNSNSDVLLKSGHELFLEFARTRLPELRTCLDRSAVRRDHRPWSRKSVVESLFEMEQACRCEACSSALFYCYGISSARAASVVRAFCLFRVANTILELLVILYNVVVDPNILLSHYGILSLYEETKIVPGSEPFYLFPGGWTSRHPSMVIKIFVGSASYNLGSTETSEWAACSTQGLCAHYQLLQDPNLSPQDASRIILVPGHIEHSGVSYGAVEGIKHCHDSEKLVPWSGFFTRPDDRVDFIVQETAHSANIGGAYRIQSATSQARSSMSPHLEFFALPEIINSTRLALQFICAESHWTGWDEIKIEAVGWTPLHRESFTYSRILAMLTARTDGEASAEKEQSPFQAPPSQLLRHSTFDDRRTISYSVLVTKLCASIAHENVQRQSLSENNDTNVDLEIHKFPIFSPFDGKYSYSPPITFARLYAEFLHASRWFRDHKGGVALFGEFDDCAACLVKFAMSHLRETLEIRQGFPNRDVTGDVVWHAADGTEQSRTGSYSKGLWMKGQEMYTKKQTATRQWRL